MEKGSDGCLTKFKMKTDIRESLVSWQNKVEIIKAHVYTKRRQFAEIKRITDEIVIHLNYSENYKCKQQNEIQSAFFGNKGFSLFTACAYHSKDGELCKMSITVTTEENDNPRVAAMSCVNNWYFHAKLQPYTIIIFITIQYLQRNVYLKGQWGIFSN